MKALILAGGTGSRLRPLTQTGAKQLLPVGNKPIIHYVLEDVRAAGITDVGVIIGNETAVGIRRDLQDGSRWGLELTYLHQEDPLGLAHCIIVAEEFLKHESFVMYLGDNLLKGGIGPFAAAFRERKPNALTVLREVRNPTEFGVAEFHADGRLKRLVEKPASPPSNWALTGIYFFDHHIIEAARAIQPSRRGELEITDAIQWLLDNGFKVDYEMLTDWWKDAGNPQDLLESNVLVLQDLKGSVHPSAKIDGESQIIGEVQVESDVVINRSVIRGPVIVGPGSTIEEAYIGASTSLGAGSVVKNSEVSYSIVMEGATIVDVPTPIDWSLIGREAVVCRGEQKPRALNLVLGDLSRVGLV